MNILFLGGGRRTSLYRCFQKACEAEGIECNLFSYELSHLVPVSKCATVIEGRDWDAPSFQEEILSIIARKQIQIVIPLMDKAATVLSSFAEEVTNVSCWPAVSNHMICQICEDKLAADTWFSEHHVLTPAMHHGHESDGLIAKPRFGFGGRGIKKIRSSEAHQYERQGFIVQPIVRGPEFTVDAYVSKDGVPLACVTRKRLRVADGEAVNSLTSRRELLIAKSQQILRDGRFRGPVTLQAIENTDKYWFIDINPRFGGGVILSIYAGADIPRLLIREVMGLPVKATKWRENILMTRAYEEVFFDLKG